ncbi:hypothetical protein ACFP1I_09710 [Dyadobacter subterraneus]|uniref:Uncharacterized protein n=1 Tax=Dyadobacter subterraneus TaxID=2773304 RepID=A0ABR9WAY5_9BACT|nr:hypothetical protein [Dyadobacter subterraneus]MBE9462622.1 hypothetical protein [Dyadobacter subterraneus]
MNLKIIGSLFYIFLFLTSKTATAQLSESSKIGILTIGPGKDVYSAFGHSAMRITDTVLRIDNV